MAILIQLMTSFSSEPFKTVENSFLRSSQTLILRKTIIQPNSNQTCCFCCLAPLPLNKKLKKVTKNLHRIFIHIFSPLPGAGHLAPVSFYRRPRSFAILTLQASLQGSAKSTPFSQSYPFPIDVANQRRKCVVFLPSRKNPPCRRPSCQRHSTFCHAKARVQTNTLIIKRNLLYIHPHVDHRSLSSSILPVPLLTSHARPPLD